MIDSYEKFLSEYITKEDFFNFGLNETIYIPTSEVDKEWKNLKNRIKNNEEVFIRGYGRNAAGTSLFFDFYNKVFQHSNVSKDATNNDRPTRLLEKLTQLKKNKDIRNYQVSHVFGRTKNIFAFTAPWNIIFMPKILDPFTGHEAKGTLVDEFQLLFKQQNYNHFKTYIDEFNDIVTDTKLLTSIDNYFYDMHSNNSDSVIIEKLRSSISDEFEPILIENTSKEKITINSPVKGNIMTKYELGSALKQMCADNPSECPTMIRLFGIKYANQLQQCSSSKKEIIEIAGLQTSYQVEIGKGISLAKYVVLKDDCK